MNDPNIFDLADARQRMNESHPADGEPAITMYMDDDRIVFRDQATLDDYVREAKAEPPSDVTEAELRAIIRNAISLDDPAATARWMRDHLHITRRAR